MIEIVKLTDGRVFLGMDRQSDGKHDWLHLGLAAEDLEEAEWTARPWNIEHSYFVDEDVE